MKTNRLEAFSDGVLAIVITIMVLEMKVPEGASWDHLSAVLPKFMSYLLSFVYLGIYWNNHHHLFQAIQRVNGKVLWSNLLLLFTLSLVPFTTAWMGENHFEKNPVILYGMNLLLCAIAYALLENASTGSDGKSSVIGSALTGKRKEAASVVLYLIGIVLAVFYPSMGISCFIVVAAIWLIPDKRIENQLKK
ncbi:TMEM175 family protein [Galbibacter sp. PAP.153]|uniref:TMEM175 family protein n=1 Tax=Galbibacter sp. PAP.153 TaxID=3104623 RepID=UPI00300AEE30